MSSISKSDKLKGCLYGLFIGDALSMPVHWYYDVKNITKDFGPDKIQKYEAPKDKVVGSYMSIAEADKDLVGKVILHGKTPCYEKGRGAHYHTGMQAGENTLDATIAMILMECVKSESGGGYTVHVEDFLSKYVDLFTTPAAHNDSYAATAHRMFFRNWVKKDRKNSECAGYEAKSSDAIDALVNVVILAAARHAASGSEGSKETDKTAVASTIQAIRNSPDVLPRYGILFFKLLLRVLSGDATLREAVLEAADEHDPSGKLASDVKATPEDPMVPCPIELSYPAVLHFAYKYGESPNAFRTALLASTNAGGENVNRGSCLGALLGASCGFNAIVENNPDLVQGLVAKDLIESGTTSFLKEFGVTD
eukprot:TRINITY_DN4252_c0_g1_i1.p1 TRINITY_DN4252_c0_g1~~TRINITY_DN4252_c0_g1_i1.p1  ORF type:complete len:366 (+),score=69.87 TRINITY_DN4252_c0_g1_i1:51-1148(+)